jgi:hypothetical protein
MNLQAPTGGRELNEISAPAGQHYKPVFFRLLKFEKQEAVGELAEARQSGWQHQPVTLFHQTSNY